MEKINIKYESIVQAVASLERAIQLFEKSKKYIEVEFCLPNEDEPLDMEEVSIGLRDSVIQRFKYSVDLLWKYLKDYLEVMEKMVPDIQSPKHIIRSCSQVGLLSEPDTIKVIEMLDNRNLSSHIYREEIAQQMVYLIPSYYELMVKILNKTKP